MPWHQHQLHLHSISSQEIKKLTFSQLGFSLSILPNSPNYVRHSIPRNTQLYYQVEWYLSSKFSAQFHKYPSSLRHHRLLELFHCRQIHFNRLQSCHQTPFCLHRLQFFLQTRFNHRLQYFLLTHFSLRRHFSLQFYHLSRF